MELGKHTLTDVGTTTTRLTHSGHNLKVADEVLDNFGAIVPETVVDPLTEQLDWGLSAESLLLGHVEVINETDSLELGTLRLESVLGTSVEP